MPQRPSQTWPLPHCYYMLLVCGKWRSFIHNREMAVAGKLSLNETNQTTFYVLRCMSTACALVGFFCPVSQVLWEPFRRLHRPRCEINKRRLWSGLLFCVHCWAAVSRHCKMLRGHQTSLKQKPKQDKPLVMIMLILIRIIRMTIFIVLSIRHQPYARVHFGSSGRKSVSAKWPPTRRPSCKLDI